jgi:Flp pilus assembly protein TadG
VSIEMMFGTLALLLVVALLFEATAYWHARNVLDDAAADGARIAAAFDGSCAAGIAAAQASVARQARSWAAHADVSCIDGDVVTVTVRAKSPGIVGGALGFSATASESAPKER